MTSTTPLLNKVALITGSSKGIGLATATHLSSLGAKVVINYSSSSSTAADAAVASLGGPENAIAIQADVSSLADLQRLVDTTVSKWGKIDILVCNAGVMALNELENVSESEFDRVFAINVKGPLFLAQVCLFYIYIHPPFLRSFVFSLSNKAEKNRN